MELQGQVLIALSGLPGSGKSTLARAMARELQICLLELDRIEFPMLRRVDGDVLGFAGYEALTALAEQQLETGLSVIVDAVSWTTALRSTWATIASKTGAAFRPLEVVCSDTDLHRQRVEGRHPTEKQKPTWLGVQQSRDEFWEPWVSPVFVADTAHSFDDVLARVLAYVSA